MMDEAAPTVSVVIPAYNASRFIAATLDSVHAQTYTDYEVIVVDDGSADDTGDVVEAYFAHRRMRGRCVRQQNKKIAGARNTGMRAARGPYIALLDHDDLWYPPKLSKVMQAFAEHPEVDLVGHHINVTRDGTILRMERKGPAVPRMYERLLLIGNALSPSAVVVRKDKVLAIGGFREAPEFNTVEDYDFWMRLSLTSRFHFLDEALAEYPLVATSASSNVDYHFTNLETLLREHFLSHFGPTPGLVARLKMRRRMGSVYRAAAGAAAGERQAYYVRKMLAAYPFAIKNIGRAAQWLLRRAWK
ncbi:MAG: glycosyltransferase family A protein [Elusimicrobiota bacterium]